MDLKQVNAEQRVQVLQHQNQRLAVQLNEKTKATRVLEDKVSDYEAKEQEYAQTLLCVRRIWDQVNSEVQHLAASSGLPEESPEREGSPSTPSAAALTNPFLRRLLSRSEDADARKEVADGQRALQSDASDVESTLQEQASATHAALAKLLSALHSLHASQQTLSEQLRNAPGSTDDALKQENERLAQEAGKLRQALDASRAKELTSQEGASHSEGRLLEVEERMRKMQDELADTEQELATANRKLATLKSQQAAAATGEGADGLGGAGGSMNGLLASRQSSLAGALGTGPSSELHGDELLELQALLAKRTGELEKERETSARLSR